MATGRSYSWTENGPTTGTRTLLHQIRIPHDCDFATYVSSKQARRNGRFKSQAADDLSMRVYMNDNGRACESRRLCLWQERKRVHSSPIAFVNGHHFQNDSVLGFLDKFRLVSLSNIAISATRTGHFATIKQHPPQRMECVDAKVARHGSIQTIVLEFCRFNGVPSV